MWRAVLLGCKGWPQSVATTPPHHPNATRLPSRPKAKTQPETTPRQHAECPPLPGAPRPPSRKTAVTPPGPGARPPKRAPPDNCRCSIVLRLFAYLSLRELFELCVQIGCGESSQQAGTPHQTCTNNSKKSPRYDRYKTNWQSTNSRLFLRRHP